MITKEYLIARFEELSQMSNELYQKIDRVESGLEEGNLEWLNEDLKEVNHRMDEILGLIHH